MPTVCIYNERVRNIPESYVSPAMLDWIHSHMDRQKRILAKPEELPEWDTQVHELMAPDGSVVRLRRYTNDGSLQGPAILYLAGSDSRPYGGDPYLENGVKSPYPLFSLDRTYLKGSRVHLDDASEMQQMKTALQYLYQMTGQKVHVVGFSLGGLYAAKLPAQCPNEVKDVALLSPSMPTPNTVNDYVGILPPEERTPENIAEIHKAAAELPAIYQQIKVPAVFYTGEKELTEILDEDPLAKKLITENIPQPFEQFKVFKGIYDERHMVTLARLNALSQWWQSGG